MVNNKIPILYKNTEKVNWKIPSLFCNDSLILTFSDICKELNIKFPVKSVYGGVKCSWNGGRPLKDSIYNGAYYAHIINLYNKRNISVCFTFSNYYIDEKDLYDTSANDLLQIASKSGRDNYAIVSSDLLNNYIKANYPHIKTISSMLKPIYECPEYEETPDYYNNLCRLYDKVVIRPEFCFDDTFLKKLKYKNKIEIIVNLSCMWKCPLARKHYDYFYALDKDNTLNYKDFCSSSKKKLISAFKRVSIDNCRIQELIKMGFTEFKLEGRFSPPEELYNKLGMYIYDSTGLHKNLRYYVLDKTSPYKIKVEEELAAKGNNFV